MKLLLFISLLLVIGKSATGEEIGCIKGDCVNGSGTFMYRGGDRYEGLWEDDDRTQGAYYYANGNRYLGTWKNDEKVAGTFYFANGGRFEGTWKNDSRDGAGISYYATGNRYEGMHKDDQRHGQGAFYFASGEYFKGQWQDSKRNGPGILYAKTGKILQDGLWKDDAFIEPKTRDTTPPTITMQRGIGIVSTSKHTVYGQAIDISGVAVVEVDGREAVLDASGNFTLDILLKPGNNEITVVAIDTKFNSTSKVVTVSRTTPEVAKPRSADRDAQQSIQTGKYHALIIGVEDYSHDSISDLSEPLQDAQKIKQILERDYTFDGENIELLANPTRDEILDELDRLSSTLTTADNLIIFYAGHGYWDKQSGQGYWLPSDARENRRRDWIANGTIVDYLNTIKTKHTLLISDACFSGGIFKTRDAFAEKPDQDTRALYNLPSRKAMTSGTLRKVPDRSVFVRYMTKRLADNTDKYLSSQDLFSRFRKAAANNSPIEGLVPQWGEVQRAGDEGGDFIFVRR